MFKYLMLFTSVFFCSFAQVIMSEDVVYEIKSVNSKSNRLYVGIDNVIILKGLDTIPKELSFSTSNGVIFLDEGEYVIIPSKTGVADIRAYAVNSSQDSILIGESTLVVDNYPRPNLAINDVVTLSGSEISKAMLLKSDSVSLHFSDDILNVNNMFTISSFTVGYKYGSNYMSHKAFGNKITKVMKETIATLSPGQEVIVRVSIESNLIQFETKPIFRFKIY